MGANMARNLKDRGYNITAINDTDHSAAQELADELGAKNCTSLSDLTSLADIVFTVVSNDTAMRDIYLNKTDSLLSNNTAGTVFVNCATVSDTVQKDIDKAARLAGAETLEAAMASSISQARDGSLFLIIGGEESTFLQLKPILTEMSMNLTYTGEIGKAAQVKALVNMVMNINTAALAEGLGLADALGLNLEMIRNVFAQTGANSRVLETDSDDMVDRDHEAWFTAEHAAKDSGLAQDLAHKTGLDLPLNDATKAQYDKLVREGKGELDKSAISELTFKGRHLNND